MPRLLGEIARALRPLADPEYRKSYANHTGLNLGQAVRDVRYFYYHPKADAIAAEGTVAHVRASLPLRAREFAGNLFFAGWPPHLHHSQAQLQEMRHGSVRAWFWHGYKPWEYQSPAPYRSGAPSDTPDPSGPVASSGIAGNA